MALYTPGHEPISSRLDRPRLERSIAPGSYLPPEAHYELAAGIQGGLQGQTAILAEMARILQDIRAGLGAQAAYGSPADAAAARGALGVVNTANVQAESPSGPQPGRPRVVSTAEAHQMAAKGLGEAAGQFRVSSFAEGRQAGLGAIKGMVVNRAARAVSEMTFGGDLYEGVEVPAGYRVEPGQPVDPEVLERAAQWHPPMTTEPDSQTIYTERGPDGVSRAVDAAVAARAMRSIGRANAVRTAVSAVGQGQGLRAGVAAAAPRLAMGLGYAGMGVAAVQQGYQMYTQQLAANRPYQQVLGGGISEGFNERFNQNVFRIRNALSFNPIGSAESEKIYQGALQTYAGDTEMRGVAQSVMSGLYRSTGMSPEDSLRVIKIAADEGNTALGQIAVSLRDVTKTAREAGINAEEARDRFTQTYAALATSIQGPGAAALAAAQTQAVVGLGHGFQNLGIDVSTQRNLLIGSPLGMTSGEVQNLQQSDPTRYAQLDQESRTAFASRILEGRGINQQIAEYMRSEGLGEGKAPTTRQRREMGQLVNAALPPELAVDYARNFLGLTGVDTSNAGEAIVMASMGYPDVAGEMEENMADLAPRDFAGGRGGREEILKDLGYDDAAARSLAIEGRYGTRGKGAAVQRYMDMVERTGERNMVLERIISDYDKERRYKVHTAGGEKVVGNWELIESFADQAAAGDVEIVAGGGRGETIETAIANVDLPGYADEADSAKETYEGKTFKDDKKGGGGEVIIRAGPELQRWIDITTTGSASYVDQRTGTTSYSPTHPDGRATG